MQINKNVALNPSVDEIHSKILINPDPKLIKSYKGTIIYTFHFKEIKLSDYINCNLILLGDEYSTELPHKVLRGKKKYFEVGDLSFCMIPGIKFYTIIIKEPNEKTVIIKEKASKLPFPTTEDMIIRHY